MAVPSGNSHLKNTVGGAFSSQTQGGTVLGNGTTGSVITKALLLKDAVYDTKKAYSVVERAYPVAGGLYGTQKILSGGTFAYFEVGKYIIRTISTTISGVASNEVLIPGADKGDRRSIHQFIHDFGVRLLAKWRANEFSWTGVLDDGTKITRRFNWLNAAGDGVAVPVTATNLDMVNPVGGATGRKTDSAANPTRAIPGELVMKVDFVDTSVATGGDFFNYKPITGM
jgi:hypothetical protein